MGDAELWLIPTGGGEVNENGFDLEQMHPDQGRLVYAERKSVGYAEFYKANQAGYKAELKFDVYAEEYRGEGAAVYDGKTYTVIRTYTGKNKDKLELTLGSMPVRGGVANGEV